MYGTVINPNITNGIMPLKFPFRKLAFSSTVRRNTVEVAPANNAQKVRKALALNRSLGTFTPSSLKSFTLALIAALFLKIFHIGQTLEMGITGIKLGIVHLGSGVDDGVCGVEIKFDA
jgi:hypothetical protein